MMPVVASSTRASAVRARATITPDRSTPRCRLFQPRLPPSSMFRSGPFTLAHDRESRAVDEEKQAGTCGGATQREIEMLATPGACGVIGRGQVETQHPEDRRQEAFSLPQGQVEMSRSVSAVSMARSAYCRCSPRVPTPTASQVAIAARPVAPSQAVSGPRRRSRTRRACALTRWCVARGGGPARGAGRRGRPRGAGRPRGVACACCAR